MGYLEQMHVVGNVNDVDLGDISRRGHGQLIRAQAGGAADSFIIALEEGCSIISICYAGGDFDLDPLHVVGDGEPGHAHCIVAVPGACNSSLSLQRSAAPESSASSAEIIQVLQFVNIDQSVHVG